MQKVKKLYQWINNESGDISCNGISPEACAEVPNNYFKNMAVNIFSQLADTIANPKTVLAALMLGLGIPNTIISLIVPVRESGSMLPQIFLAEFLKNKKLRKKYWLVGSMMQSLSLIGIGVSSFYLSGISAGILIVVLLIIFSFGRAWCSFVSKDIIGKIIPKSKRGRLIGYGNAISGIFVVIIGYFLVSNNNLLFLSYSLIAAGILWLLVTVIYSQIYEPEGEIDNSTPSFKKTFNRFSLLRTDKVLQKFIIARSLLLASALTAPFYIIMSENYIANNTNIGFFVLATAIASIVSSIFWGRFSDVSSRLVIFYAAMVSSLVGVITIAVVWIIPSIQAWFLLYPLVVFVLSIAHNGVRIGRKTYIVDIAEGNQRSDYVAVSNTIIGIVLLIVGVASSLLSLISVPVVIMVLSVVGLFGAYLSYKLPEVHGG